MSLSNWSTKLGWTLAAGVFLAIFQPPCARAVACERGGAAVGMCILRSALLGIIVLGKALTAGEALGMVLAIAGVVLIARS